MSRTRARELVLVNWKGVFFERYLLDPNVTALEGDNGAGKTTVMVAAYVTLLPDLSRLRFTNLGETGATGGDKGIWGRLGNPARPSFSALTLELGEGATVIAGVHLKRKSEPSLELSPFIISGLSSEARARDFLLQATPNHDEIPTLEGVKELVTARGATIEVFASNKAYFAALFALGVNPMRLGSDEELNKYNDMLRTSMTGGISRALTSELRSFVFKEELGLSDTLGRMRTSLSACRKTRTEVAESRELQRHITGVFSAGVDMFETAMAAARMAAVEQAASGTRAEKALNLAEAHLEQQSHELKDALARQELCDTRAAALERAAEQARDEVLRVERALDAARRIQSLQGELAEADRAVHEQRALQQSAAFDRGRDKQQRDRQQADLMESAQGLANLQAGLSELHRRAHASRHAHAELARAATLITTLGWDDLALADELRTDAARGALSTRLGQALGRAREALAQCDRERAQRLRDSEAAELLRHDYDAARQALDALLVQPPSGSLIDAARGALAEAQERERLALRQGALERELRSLQTLQKRQVALLLKAEQAGLTTDGLSTEAVHTALYDLDAVCRDQRERARTASWNAREALEAIERLEAKLRHVEELEIRSREFAEARTRLESVGVELGPDDDSLLGARANLMGRIHQLEQRLTQLSRERDHAASLAGTLGEQREAASPAVLELRDLLDGALLASRFEELEPETARLVEARLGPLVHAIVVEDVAHARDLLASVDRQCADVYLIAAGADLAGLSDAPDAGGRDVAVASEGATRITRVPEVASLGRVARERRARSLRRVVEERERAIEDEERALRGLWSALEDLELLRANAQIWRERQLAAELNDLRGQLEAARERAVAGQSEAETAAREAEAARVAAAALRPLLPELALLDEPDLEHRAENCRATLGAARAAARELEGSVETRAKLTRMLDALHHEPPSPAAIAAWKEQAGALAERRDRLFAAVETLEELSRHEHALYYRDAERALDERRELVPELEAQHQELALLLQAAEERVQAGERRWEAETEKLQSLTAARAAIAAHLARATEELARDGVLQPSEEALVAAGSAHQALKTEFDAVNQEARGLAARAALARERQTTAERARQAAQAELDRCREHSSPAEEAWRAARERAAQHGLHWTGLDLDETERHSRELWLGAQGKRLLLLDRLAAASGGGLSQDFAGADPGADALAYLELWQQVREWLQKRLPAQVANVADPVEALERLRNDLATLEGRLKRQEDELRGASGDVARSIDVQVRRATSQVKRINQYLDGIRFGGIHGIRIKMDRVEAMAPILEAMRNGNAQRLLFQANLPFEEALDEIFKRYGGGRGGGHRILDYREYVELKVEVKRQADSSAWELANPTRVSTGEAIGVGAALMMVILTEWERDATLLRSGRTHGSLRFLFLDEANRLSQDNLGVLFDLCQSLELQLLIAAPEVARAEGNTTYRLVRRLTEDGGEEVLVTGRRSQLPGHDAASPTTASSSDASSAENDYAQQPLFD
ncbi:MAG TPA: chromosome partition protein MukB [Polyangiaceae bacterium]